MVSLLQTYILSGLPPLSVAPQGALRSALPPRVTLTFYALSEGTPFLPSNASSPTSSYVCQETREVGEKHGEILAHD